MGMLRQADRKSNKTGGNTGGLAWKPLSSQKPPGLPWTGFKHQALDQCASVTRGRLPQVKRSCSVAWLGCRDSGTLRQAEGRSGETAVNAGSLPRMPVPYRMPPGLSLVCCKAADFGTWCLCVWQKDPTCKNGAIELRGGLQGLRRTLRQAEGKSDKTAENAGSLQSRPLPSQKPQVLS